MTLASSSQMASALPGTAKSQGLFDRTNVRAEDGPVEPPVCATSIVISESVGGALKTMISASLA
jgi:hypothetical protein